MAALLKTTLIQEPSSSTVNMTLGSTGGVTFGAAATANTVTSAATTALTLQSAGTTAITVDTSQNVGIGTTSPGAKLDVSGNIKFSAGNPVLQFNNGGPQIYLTTANTLQFSINSGSSEAMRIDSSGNLLVGTTTINPGIGNNTVGSSIMAGGYASFSRSATAIYVNYTGTGTGTNVEWKWQGTTVGSVSTTSTTTAYNTSSDYRLKENVTPITTGLATINALKPVNYDWISDKSLGEGFIAHELQAVIPHAVTGTKDAVDADGKPVYQGVDYSKVVVHLVAAIQEQQATIASLATRIATLEAK